MNWKHYSFVVGGKIRKLQKKRIVKCLTPKNIVGRVYTLTKNGKQIKKHLEKSEKNCILQKS